ncbi:hypothetical protein CA54_08000 [Symmachiella macrocystis]|uniref:Uncharacterized protein n=1 Tax=Symmachiella macrocystis TaxID=2527985 RepID=A0A5C6BN68_9PLAN|nr:hypothetical protein CA54_08000 [Symmachiella macrocystis]
MRPAQENQTHLHPSLLPTAYCLLPTAYWLLPTAYCLLPTGHQPPATPPYPTAAFTFADPV